MAADGKPASNSHDGRPESPPPVQQSGSASGWLFNFLSALGLIFLTVNVTSVARRSLHRPGTLFFVVFSYLDLVLLFVCLSLFQRLGPEARPEKRRRLKAAIWLLATALNLGFAWRMALLLPWPVAVTVWVTSMCVAAGGFYGLFRRMKQEGEEQAYFVVESSGEEKQKIYYIEQKSPPFSYPVSVQLISLASSPPEIITVARLSFGVVFATPNSEDLLELCEANKGILYNWPHNGALFKAYDKLAEAEATYVFYDKSCCSELCPLEDTINMASSSPVSGSKIGDSITAIAAINGNSTSQRPGAFEMPRPSQRGLNKPKCIKCGNVARSRCPFQSCKSCCAKAENPCHIHVLKQNGTLPDKPPPSSTTLLDQPSNDVSSTGSSWRLNSLRQLSTNVANILRTKNPPTKKVRS
ncbi:hypothetical protein Cni_G17911 [Canna indica]|uniref:Uncharacterized protein n=1 Tax=Canna indica TaxID=4628 RepID=A0AAQ3KLA7_9LILI|nr:hypothetical protein Cni_G17911 [Canna indica]